MNGNSLSIVIVTYNSEAYISLCLDSLAASSRKWEGSVEYLVVDNASSDRTVAYLARHPYARLIQNPCNKGFARAANQGIHRAQSEWILVLNPDTTCDPLFIPTLMSEMPQYRNHLINPLILCPDGRVNAAGLAVHCTGVSVCHGLGEKPDQFRGQTALTIAAPSGAAIAAHRDVWKSLGGFDEDYFLYMEDVDLGIRAYALGYHCLCLTAAQIVHDYRLRLTPVKFRYLVRNRLLMLQKLYNPALIKRLSWRLILTNGLIALYAAAHGWTYWMAFWQARGEIRKMPPVTRRISPLTTILPQMKGPLPLSALTTSPLIRRGLGLITQLSQIFDHHPHYSHPTD